MWRHAANVINGTETPEQAGEESEKGLESWYKPASAMSAN
jgi:raffinose/stachyose/melibiose transport system substrate-binding protein